MDWLAVKDFFFEISGFLFFVIGAFVRSTTSTDKSLLGVLLVLSAPSFCFLCGVGVTYGYGGIIWEGVG